MPRRLGIELSPTRCALIDLDVSPAGRRPVAARVRSFRSIPWSSENAEAFVATLRLLRKSRILPSRAVVALWGLEAETPSEADIRPRLAPLVAARFDIDAVIAPTAALASLSRLLPAATPGAVRALVAVNADATAIAIARGGSLLLGREIPLAFRPGAIADEADAARSAAAVDFARRLAPELKRSLLAVKQQHNADVHQVVLCGDFPALRLLIAPLVTALQIEVETLDSIRGLVPPGSHLDAALLDQAAALRIAWAAGIGGSRAASLPRNPFAPGAPKSRMRRVMPVAAAVLVMVAGWFAVGRTIFMRTGHVPAPRSETRPSAAKPSPASAPKTTPGVISEPRVVKTAVPAINDETPAPVVQSILYGADRRLALIDHQIVRVGDRLEAGVITDIEPKAIVVRRPSGRLLRVVLARPSEAK